MRSLSFCNININCDGHTQRNNNMYMKKKETVMIMMEKEILSELICDFSLLRFRSSSNSHIVSLSPFRFVHFAFVYVYILLLLLLWLCDDGLCMYISLLYICLEYECKNKAEVIECEYEKLSGQQKKMKPNQKNKYNKQTTKRLSYDVLL